MSEYAGIDTPQPGDRGHDIDTIGMVVPPQPPVASIVLDRYGKAWQREDQGWWRASRDVRTEYQWVSVLLNFGPVIVLRTGGA